MGEFNILRQAIEVAVKSGVYAMQDVVILSQILDKLETKIKQDAAD